ncbi:MAG TPA: BTAD domain-containing putative transcriptional regulator, partial [Gemmatimonadaceae bacterium]|nr:BTAD domain-containing putative transcriptional regulator [Gemmatimonadaceae bacterium]
HHSLSQALYRLRVELGMGSLVSGTRILRLDPRHISADVTEFDEAHRAHDATRMVELYAGPFLDGVFFTGALELERWIESERQRLADLCAGALRALASSAASRGDHELAAAAWRRLLTLDPFDSDIAIQLVRALDAAGDRAAALREAHRHRLVVRGEEEGDARSGFLDLLTPHASRPEPGSAARRPLAMSGAWGDDARSTAPAELCERARQSLFTFVPGRMHEAIELAHRALAVAPDYAPAHALLAWIYVLLSQATREGDPRAQARRHAERALEIEPEHVDATSALAYAEQLDESWDQALALARHAVALDPSDPGPYHALGWTCLSLAYRTGRREAMLEGVAAFGEGLRLAPRETTTIVPLSTAYILSGQYDVASALLERAVELERESAGATRMFVSPTLLGMVRIRQGRYTEARDVLARAAIDNEYAAEIYASWANALTLCALGDLDRFAARHPEAVARYERAYTLLNVNPQLIGSGQVAVGVDARLACAYHRLHMRPEEERHFRRGQKVTAERGPYCFNWCWGVADAWMHYDWSVYHATVGDRDAVRDDLHHAIALGWRETRMLELEPAFASMRGDRVLERVIHEAQRRSPLPLPASVVAATQEARRPHAES